MNSKVHYWIVCDAVAYIKNAGTPRQKKALQSLELAYGQRKSIEEIPASETAIERLAGFESWHTDKYADLSLRIPGLLWRSKRNVTGLFGHTFTAFNHFINPYPDVTRQWSSCGGYSYESSSKQGFDSFVVKGISRYLRGLVDKEHSLVLDRVRPDWQQGMSEWKANFQRGLVNTSFVPWSVLAKFYYTYFLSDQNTPLEVRGPNSHVVGLQLLGPVFHAIADACSPQHVRPALGLGHQAWENYVQSRVYAGQISLNPALIANIMSTHPFNPALTVPLGEYQGRFDVESFVHQLSVLTARVVSKSTSSTWRDLYEAGEKFWKWYLTGEQVHDDATYLYHQAIAGTIHAIERACTDLESLGILMHDCLQDDNKLPCIECIQDDGIEMPHKVLGDEDAPAEDTRPDPLQKTSDVLGIAPSNHSKIQELITQFEVLYAKSGHHDPKRRDFVELLDQIEATAVQEYEVHGRRPGSSFCPLRSMERIPVDSDVSAHFGVETFRLPSLSECNDPELFAGYMDKIEDHSDVAHKLELTMCAASLEHLKATCEGNESRCRRIDDMIDTLHHERDDT